MGFGGSGFFVLRFWVLLWLFNVLGDFVSVVFFVCFCFGFCSGFFLGIHFVSISIPKRGRNSANPHESCPGKLRGAVLWGSSAPLGSSTAHHNAPTKPHSQKSALTDHRGSAAA